MTLGPLKRPVRVLVVDDHADVRFLVRAILRDAGPDVEFAGEAPGAAEAVEALLSSEPLSRLGALMAVDADGRLRGVITLEQVSRALQARLAPRAS